MLAVRLSDNESVNYAVAHAPDYGLILDYFLFCGDSFRIAPPLTINDEEILWACSQLNKLLDDVMKKKMKNETYLPYNHSAYIPDL